MNPHLRDVTIPNDWDRRGLPGWSYHSGALLELEKEHVFRNHWQIVGHVCDVPNPGDYLTMDVVGERALVVRGKDGVVRGFNNMCRHRGSRVVADDKGNCRNALVCPFHGWVYNLDGTLRGAARPRSFPDIDKTEFGLMQLDLEIWMGFIFIRFRKGGPQPSVAELLAPVEAEIAHYNAADMVPSWGIWTQKTPVTGSPSATSTMRAIMSPWRTRRCRIFTAPPISTSPSSTACSAPSPPTIRMPGAAGASGSM